MAAAPGNVRPTFLHSDRLLARAAQPLVRFLHIEAAGGILLFVATVIALVWANSPWQASYQALWSTTIRLDVGSYVFEEDFAHLVNDLFMAIFFFVVGMEIKRELVVGELRDRRSVAMPALAALGGMVVPALIYVVFTNGGAGADGWGVPMATDIAFALGVVALLGSRVPGTVKVLLLSLAIIDDIGAIVVIAVFYSSELNVIYLLAGLGIVLVVVAAHRLDVVYTPVLLGLGLMLWLAIYESGVHATIAGVVMGLLAPARPLQTEIETARIVDTLDGTDVTPADVRATADLIRGSVSTCDRLIDALHPWTSFVIVPLFALANAGIVVTGDAIANPTAVLAGVTVGLVVGKFVGILSFSWLAVRFGFGKLPAEAGWGHIAGVAAIAGIGFTVSLFITALAFDTPAIQDQAKIGILTASVLAALLGAAIFTVIGRQRSSASPLPHERSDEVDEVVLDEFVAWGRG